MSKTSHLAGGRRVERVGIQPQVQGYNPTGRQRISEQKRGSLYCKVSQKGAISVYGLQRMPVTLYVEQWERLLDFGDEIRKFASEHDSELKRKNQ